MKEENKVALYVFRIDGDEDLIEQDVIRLKKYCQLKNYEVKEVYTDFKGYEIKEICDGLKCMNFSIKNRDVVTNLLKGIENGNFNKVIISSLYTPYMNINDFITLVEPMYSNNCTLETLDDFDMFSYIGKTKTSLFTFFKDIEMKGNGSYVQY